MLISSQVSWIFPEQVCEILKNSLERFIEIHFVGYNVRFYKKINNKIFANFLRTRWKYSSI